MRWVMTKRKIRSTDRRRNWRLHRLAQKHGGQSKLARKLGISQNRLSYLILQKDAPAVQFREVNHENWLKLDVALALIGGPLLQDLFPKPLPNPKPSYSEAHVDKMQIYAEGVTHRLILEDPSEAAERSEAAEELYEFIKFLTDREKTIITMRFGLDGWGCRTLDEVAAEVKVTRERVRQIEAKALHKLTGYYVCMSPSQHLRAKKLMDLRKSRAKYQNKLDDCHYSGLGCQHRPYYYERIRELTAEINKLEDIDKRLRERKDG